jgi:hypothetical protein
MIARATKGIPALVMDADMFTIHNILICRYDNVQRKGDAAQTDLFVHRRRSDDTEMIRHEAIADHRIGVRFSCLIRPRGVTPLIHQYGETMTATTREDGPSGSPEQSPDVLKKRWPGEA